MRKWFNKKNPQPSSGYDKLDTVLAHLKYIELLLESKGDKIMALLDDLTAEVARNTQVDESAKVLIAGLAQKIQDLINASAGSVDPAALQGLVDSLKADNDALSAAVVANTPADPAVTP